MSQRPDEARHGAVRRWVLASTVAALGGCFSRPQPPACEPADNSTPGLEIAGRTVAWPQGMRLGFADPASTVAMPELLDVSGTNLIAPPAGCTEEDRLGVALYPMFSAFAAPTLNNFTNRSLQLVVEGPAYAVVEVGWERPYSCAGGPSSATGTTRFGLFPDGRIVRTDRVTVSSVPLAFTTCEDPSCNSDTFLLTTYTAFDEAHLMAWATIPTVPGPQAPVEVPFMDGTLNIGDGGCVVDRSGGRVALRWDDYGAPPHRRRARSEQAQRAMPMHREVVLVLDMENVSLGEPLPIEASAARTTMILDRGGQRTCAELLARAEALPLSGDLEIDGTLVPLGADQVYDASAGPAHAGPVTVRAAGQVAPGAVIALGLEATSLTTSRAPDGVIWQRDETTGVFHVWFRDGISAGETITITPAC